MQENETFKLIFKSKFFLIPSNIRFLSDISPSIFTTLISQKSYEVKSDINEDTFQYFIDFLTNRKIPDLTPNNINEYDILSQEFDIMKDLIQLYKNKNRTIDKLASQKQFLLQHHDKIAKENEQKTINYQQIIRLLLKDTQIDTYCKFLTYRVTLFEACQAESVHLISLYCKKTVKIDNDYTLILNEEKKTACILRFWSKCNSIPRTIEYKKQEYLITGLHEGAMRKIDIDSPLHISKNSELEFIEKEAFSYATVTRILVPPKITRIEEKTFANCNELQRVEFEANSKLKTIEKNAFLNSAIKSLFIPSCVSEFIEGWCKSTPNLVNIVINPSDEQNIVYYDNNFIIGKSDTKSDTFDVLLFARRNIEVAIIPPFVKEIAPYAFERCLKLRKIEFTEDSQLLKIGSFAFSYTSLKSLSIPSSVVEFQFGWCYNTPYLTDIKIMKGEKQNILFYENKFIIWKSDQKIEKFDTILVARRDVDAVIIPSFIKKIDSFAFEKCVNLQKVEFQSDSELKEIGNNAFMKTSICNVTIPPSVYMIGRYSFAYCNFLQSFEISSRNELCYVNSFVFFNTLLKKLTIPSSGIKFQNDWCRGISQLSDINIVPNGKNCISYYDNKYIVEKSLKSDNFDTIVFARRDIENTIVLPSFIKKIATSAFEFIKVMKVKFAEGSEIKEINEFSFANSLIERITIPSSVIHIAKNAFACNNNLKSVEFADNSQLDSINMYSINTSLITSIKIPSSVTIIHPYSFHNCKNLQVVEFEEDSKLISIGLCAFNSTSLAEITIPSSVTCIEKFAFNNCVKLKKVTFSPNSKLMLINEYAFAYTNITSITIPNRVCYIESYAFLRCESLTAVRFLQNSSLKTIGKYAFYKTSITSISIPSSVVLIDDCAFDECASLQEVEILEDSNLYFIGYGAFTSTAIEKFFIPKHVIHIDGLALMNCENLQIVECAENSELKTIGKNAFSETPVTKISLPSGVSEFYEDWCSLTNQLSEISVLPTKEKNIIYYEDNYLLLKSDPKVDNYDVLVFVNRLIEDAVIPSFVKRIASCAFCNCRWLETVTFPDDSELAYIDNSAFSNSCVDDISFPASLISIGEDVFADCQFLGNIDFSKATNLKTIGRCAFYNSSIRSITVPSCVMFHEGPFYRAESLNSINIIPNEKQNVMLYNDCFLICKSDPKSDNFDTLTCFLKNNKKAIIPSFVKTIAPHILAKSLKLESLKIEPNSELNLIDEYAFYFSELERICIPKSVTKIECNSFGSCQKLRIVEFEENSSLKFIENYAFGESALMSFSIPKNVIKIGYSAFSLCKNLQILELEEDSQLRSLNSNAFDNSPNVIVMIPAKLNGKILLST